MHMHDQTETLEPDPQACATIGMAESGAGDDGREIRHRTVVQVQPRGPDKASTLDLRSRQNEALPIHSLPTELLLQVIHHYMRPYSKGSGFHYYPGLITLTGVYSRWCNVIRDSPSLWNRIHWWDSSEIIEIALQRSSYHPLDIVLHTEHVEQMRGHMEWLMDVLVGHSDRWRSIDISSESLEMGYVVTALQWEPAPNLERLSLTEFALEFGFEELGLFGGSAPRLTELTLHDISLWWESEVIHDLTVLDLGGISFLSTDTILDVLSHSPRLRTLSIYRCSTESMANPSSPPVQLPHLTSLRVKLNSLDATEDLLGHIEAPERCSLITYLQAGEEIEDFPKERLLKWMSKWKGSALVPVEGLMLGINGDGLWVELYTTDRSEPLRLIIEDSGCSWVDQVRVALPQLIDALESWTKDVTTLRLRLGYPSLANHDFSLKQFIIDQVSRLPPVTYLELSDVSIDSLLHGLRLEDVSSVFRNIRTVSFLLGHAFVLHDWLERMCETVQIVEDAAAESSSDEPNRRGHVLKLELHLLPSVASKSTVLVEVAVKDLERIAGSGSVLVVEDD